MSIFNRKRVREWLEAVKDVKDNRLSLYVKLLLHLPGMRVPKQIWNKRIRTCSKCPIYHPHKKTCGHDLEISGVGCGCYMPFKSASMAATCWARDNDLTLQGKVVGWGNDINDMTTIRTCHTTTPVYGRDPEG
jgi:hypothetical protein